MATKKPPIPADSFTEYGASGLKQYAGYTREEWLPALIGRKGILTLKEMRDNDPIIGAIFFAIEMLLRGVSFHVEGADSTSDNQQAADFIESCLGDMEESWSGLLAEILNFLLYGWDVHETVYKLRRGDSNNPKFNSKYEDGMVGWRKFAIRGQETLLHWIFDEPGDATHLVQLLPTGGPLLQVPLSKCLHFRTTPYKANPEGRALDPETPIPTPDGWRLLDDLHPGDKVFDEQGRIRYVMARADWYDRPCYRLTFRDGTDIIADANHEWTTQTVSERSNRMAGRVRKTQQIAQRPTNTNGVSEHAIPWADALDYPTQALPLDPYFLGLWLGDGHSNSAQISCHADDLEETVALIAACGFTTETRPNGLATGAGRLISVYGKTKWAHDGPASLMTALGLRNNKHIPDGYLHGSVTQRMALLSGLMDSDGYVDGIGRCEFTNTNYGLAASVADLVRSLGIGASLSVKKYAGTPSSSAPHAHTSWSVKFTPTWTPFRLSRKAAKCRTERQRKYHYIVKAESVAARRTVCIEVDSPSHLFLAGPAMVPTHNSIIRNAYTSYYYQKVIQEIEAIGCSRDLTGLTCVWVPPKWTMKNATPEDKLALANAKTLARDIARNQQEGIVVPLMLDDKDRQVFDIKLLGTGGRRQFPTNEILDRYAHRIAATVLADFITLGSSGASSRGSFAQSKNKTDIFSVAVIAFLDLITAEFNRKAIPELMELNAMDGEVMLTHGDIKRRDLQELGTYLLDAFQAGALTPDPALEAHIREEGGLPAPAQDSGRDLQAGGEASGEGGDDDPADVRAAQGGNTAKRRAIHKRRRLR